MRPMKAIRMPFLFLSIALVTLLATVSGMADDAQETVAPRGVQLPEHMSDATQEEIDAYVQELASEDRRLKIETGKKRYEQRMAVKSALVDSMKTQAQRQVAINRKEQEQRRQIADDFNASINRISLLVFVAVLAGILGWWMFRYYSSRRQHPE
ncbi:hypothetical protein JXA32_04005 [Candidatus Sumerlaeota bacterium]|nr:hypothetical protein [Candidatus Sumerlaeota bacterium]